LSRFLVTFVLQELTLGSRLYLCDEGLDRFFETQMDRAIPIWTRGPYVHGGDHNFHWWGNVLVGHFVGGYWHSANSPAGIDFLTANQGPVNHIGLIVGRPWSLDIESDGSAKARYLKGPYDETAHAPPGTFDFQRLITTLSSALSETGNHEQNAMVYFRRKGQRGGVWGKHLHDSQLVRSLFQQVLSHAVEANPALNRRIAEELTLST
jgi:hypothetical protein